MAALWVWPVGSLSYVILTGSFDADEIVAAVLLGAGLSGEALRAEFDELGG